MAKQPLREARSFAEYSPGESATTVARVSPIAASENSRNEEVDVEAQTRSPGNIFRFPLISSAEASGFAREPGGKKSITREATRVRERVAAASGERNQWLLLLLSLKARKIIEFSYLHPLLRAIVSPSPCALWMYPLLCATGEGEGVRRAARKSPEPAVGEREASSQTDDSP